jgi:hypothetical protein
VAAGDEGLQLRALGRSEFDAVFLIHRSSSAAGMAPVYAIRWNMPNDG